jgi:hypothetical protein
MKKMIIGIMIGLFLGISTNAFAAIGDTVQAVFASFNYVVNGDSKTIESPVLVYEGTSYVRTTDIANMLGFDVTYKSDSRTIAFNKPELTPAPTSATGGIPTPTPSPTPSLTPASTSVPAPSLDPSATPAPSSSPTATATATPSPTPEPSATPTPAPSNLAQCQAISNDYNSQIAMVGYGGGTDGQKRLKVHTLEYERDQALSAAGCN